MKSAPNARPIAAATRCPAEVAARRPERRSEHPPAVQRQRREKVEDEQREVDVAEPRSDPVDLLDARDRRRRDSTKAAPITSDTSGAGDRDPELRARCREQSPRNLRDAPEQPRA